MTIICSIVDYSMPGAEASFITRSVRTPSAQIEGDEAGRRSRSTRQDRSPAHVLAAPGRPPHGTVVSDGFQRRTMPTRRPVPRLAGSSAHHRWRGLKVAARGYPLSTV